MFLDAIGQT